MEDAGEGEAVEWRWRGGHAYLGGVSTTLLCGELGVSVCVCVCEYIYRVER